MNQGLGSCCCIVTVGLLLVAVLAPTRAAAATYLGVDCATCHTANLVDTHHLYADSQGLQCTACHAMQRDPATSSYVILTDVNCTNCHSGANHEAAHDNGYFVPDPKISLQCLACHQQMVTEHLQRDFVCATCHSHSDQKVQETIFKGQGPTGSPVYCLDCHYVGSGAYGVHVAAHDRVCAGCHVLTPDAKGALIGIHGRVAPRTASICADCHRNGTSELAKNTIFTVSVQNGPDYGYQLFEFFNGPCYRCHGNKTKMGSAGAKGCLPCHFLSPADSYPSEPNGFVGSQAWGHRFQKRNNTDKTVSKPNK